VDPLDAVEERIRRDLPETLEQLASYLAIPAISSKPEHRADVRRLAERVAADLAAVGLADARVLDLPGTPAQPMVVASWMGAGPDKPTVLVYGHLDLQPVDEPEWRTDPHRASRVGERLFARGAADDMGGWLTHLAATRAWMQETGGLPCNVRFVLEGEEEIGSPHLEGYMDAYPEVFHADVMVLTDCENPSVDVPGLTVSLRGLLEVELVCEALEADAHSGLWGGMVPDPTNALFLLVARLLDADGRLAWGRVEIDEARRAAGRAVPLDAATIRGGAHLLPGVDVLPERGRSAAEWMWWQPAITVVSTSIPGPERKKNAIRRRASATLSVRIAPGQTGADLLDAIREVLEADPPAGVAVRVESKPGWGESWLYHPEGPAFEAADRAYRRAWGQPLVRVGLGGTIPFVAMFGRRFSHLPLILNGVIDPETTAHGPNESLHVGVFEKMLRTNAALYAELATVPRASG
jgi:acetylornithine deacetylase/succinyl-diaminopimelate desuccinylase-like protein